jgi:hypothetical protein
MLDPSTTRRRRSKSFGQTTTFSEIKFAILRVSGNISIGNRQ